MSTLADRIREQRRVEIKIDDITLYASRATDAQAISYVQNATPDLDVISKHITGWTGVKERDVIEGGSEELIDFDHEVFMLGIGDRIDWIKPCIEKIFIEPWERLQKKIDTEKKSTPGSIMNSSARTSRARKK